MCKIFIFVFFVFIGIVGVSVVFVYGYEEGDGLYYLGYVELSYNSEFMVNECVQLGYVVNVYFNCVVNFE